MKIGLLIIGVLAGLFAGYCIWFPIWEIPYQFKYDILKDTLTIVLTVVAITIAVLGYAIYRIVSRQLQRESASDARIEVTRGAARLYTHLGFIFWKHYESDRSETHDLELAITMTERAHAYISELPEAVVKNRENDLLLCTIRNNIAYYLAERKLQEDKPLAREYSEYLRNKVKEYRENRTDWLDTCDFVDSQYPD